MQRYGRTEATSDDDVAEQKQEQPGLGAPGFGGLPNEKQTDKGVGVDDRRTKEVKNSTVDLHLEPSPILAAFAKDMSPAGKAVEELLKNPSKEAAEALLEKLDTLLPEDPATSAVIAEAMAKEFSTVPSRPSATGSTAERSRDGS